MATQTGSIDLTATNGVKLLAEAGFSSAEQTYATKSELEITNNAVALRATKTEARALANPNLTPFFSSELDDLYNVADNPTGFWYRTTSYSEGYVTKLADGWAHLERDNASGTGTAYITLYTSSVWQQANMPIVPGGTYTVLAEVRNVTVTGEPYLTLVSTSSNPKGMFANGIGGTSGGGPIADLDGELRGTTTARSDFSDCTSVTRTSIAIPAGGSVSFDLRISIYEGDYTGPYKPYVGGKIYASSAELKVTADGISTEVSKKVNGTEVISAINQSAETVKIQASKVEITGDAVFSAINNDTGTTKISGGKIDATSITIGGSGLATQADVGSIEVGGRNLFKGSSALADAWSKESTTVADGVATITKKSSGNSRIYQMPANGYWSWEAGQTYTVSIDAKGSSDSCVLQFNPASTGAATKAVSVSTEWARYSYTFTVTQNSTGSMSFFNQGETGDVIQLRYPKLEHGNRATDWTPAPEDVDADISTKLDASYNRIWYAECSTVAATTAKVATITPTTTSFTLVKGQTVNVLFTATNTAAVGDITLSVNNTGAKGIRYLNNGALANLPNANYLRINQIVTFTYDGSYWVADFSYYDSSGITNARYRTQNPNAIKAATAIDSAHIICGTSAGYKNIAANVEFDLDYPLLYATAAITAASTGTSNYLTYNGINVANNDTVQGVATNKMVYLKGTVTGNTFKIAASNFLTCTVPSSADGFVYIPLGIAYNTTPNIYFSSNKDLYAYVDGAFGPVSIREASAAAKTATNYLTDISSSGLMVHRSTDVNTGVQITDSVDIMRSGVSTANFGGTDGSTVRVGPEDSNHVSITPSEFRIDSAYGYHRVFLVSCEYDDQTAEYSSVANFGGWSDTAASTHILHERWHSSNWDSIDDGVLSLAGQHIWTTYSVSGTTTRQRLFIESPQVYVYDPYMTLTTHSSDPDGRSMQLGRPSVVESTATISAANSSNVTVTSISLPAGTWLITCSAYFAANATGRRVIYVSDSDTVSSVSVDQDASVVVPAVDGGTTKTNSTAIVSHDITTTYYCRTWQNSGGSLSVSAHLKAVRLI